ncbi:hypothetical protein PR202_gb00823 [Eleusine coracana subsp. coracana]|uniref:MO25-like protein n=1 Tax=Eleusine coracana subsp. coracana TaxID=191504 RepID=A0AAV5DUS4_ELECO|nr:hypothetical protein PR202_gb00823 [Eleusine coracana subsp. coracana]
MAGCLWSAAAAIATAAATMGSGARRKGWGLFRSSRARSPMEVVRHTRDLLTYVAESQQACSSNRDGKREHKVHICTQKDVTQVVANLQRQKVDSKIVASDYVEANRDLLDILMSGYGSMEIAIHYSTILRDCIRHQVAARYVLESEHMRKFFDYIQLPDFNIASDAFRTFKATLCLLNSNCSKTVNYAKRNYYEYKQYDELLTRHKSSAAEFFSRNYDWFFSEFNCKLLSSSNYIIRRQATQLLADILLDRSNTAVMVCYVSSKENLIVLMNLLREQSKAIQTEAFHVFKLFAANQNKPPEIVGILSANKSKILRFLADFTLDREDKQFEVDKSKVIAEISRL